MPPQPRLEIKGLSRQGLEPVVLTLMPGECLAVTGPSGAGKSLLLRALADLDPNEGEVLLDGRTRGGFSAPDWRRRVAYLPAESGWWSDRVGEHFDDREKALPLLEALGFKAETLEWEVARLSTGERQRLGLARSLPAEPSVLLLDEPTGALDAASAARVEALLQAQLEAGTSIVLVTHDPAQANRLGAVLYRMESGRLHREAPAEATT